MEGTAVIMKYSAKERIKIKSIEGGDRLMYSEIKMSMRIFKGSPVHYEVQALREMVDILGVKLSSLPIRRISLCVKE